ncbi:hypothetical protein SAMN02799631_04672 [Methylobacterium sp. 174MFSha1.1]|uniref:hypothetical protein n=1 Tax=Methylobacterium sp. 174MFSha1.1 TaxID=1502749 RepID=UPI0008E1B427|nr:hypothetical protein [Methylobacterium sp. 174MFSha1.1]SFV08166.1 hypothetical protein SAMN02799631_04672 [Methylobacterium sp. 174MFSha1.1]
MTETEILAIADEVLTRHLAASGYERAELRAGYDHDDDPALLFTAYFKPGSEAAGGAESSAAQVALRMTLLGKGEERFPYIRFIYADDFAGDDDDEDDEIEWDKEEGA